LDDKISQILLHNPELRTGKSMSGRAIKERSFTTSDFNMKRLGLSYIWGNMLSQFDNHNVTVEFADFDKLSTFMKNFFLNIRRDQYIYFVKESGLSIIRRSPLEGPYPYGRMGMTTKQGNQTPASLNLVNSHHFYLMRVAAPMF
jgi:hypothetical protein